MSAFNFEISNNFSTFNFEERKYFIYRRTQHILFTVIMASYIW